MRFFKATDDIQVTQRKLPHWAQSDTLCFITWRTYDSMPASVVEQWYRLRGDWLQRRRIDPDAEDWKQRLEELAAEEIEAFHAEFTTRWHEELDNCHGECVLRQPHLARIVRDSLLHFDGARYEIDGFVVMPNHVHLLVAFRNEETMLQQCESWKRFTATRLNAALGRKGRFWQSDAFDHLVRHEAQHIRLRQYLAENPIKAKLRDDEYILYLK